MGLQNQIINMMINSLSEELFITIIILILLKKNKYLAKENIKKNLIKIFLISVIPMAILSNTIDYITYNYGIKSLENIKPLIGIFMTAITIAGLDGIKNKREFIKILVYSLFGFVIFILSEVLTLTIVVYGLKVSPDYFNLTPYLNFVLLIPERILQYGLLAFIFLKKNSFLKVDLIKLIMRNKALRNIIIFFQLINIIVLIVLTKYIFLDNILKQYSIESQLFIIVLGVSFVIINNLTIWLPAICIYSKEKYIQKTIKEGYHDEEDDV